MSFSVNTNLNAMQAYNALSKVNKQSEKTQLRLATMKKINQVADDTSGYRVGKSLESNMIVQQAQLGNASSAKNYLSTAEISLNNINDLLEQISAKYNESQDTSKNRTSIAQDINGLATEVDSILKNTNLNGRQLLANPDGSSLASNDKFDLGGSAFTVDFASNSYLNADALKAALHGSATTYNPGTPTNFLSGTRVTYKSGGVDIIPDLHGNTSSTTRVGFDDGSFGTFSISMAQGEKLYDILFRQHLATFNGAVPGLSSGGSDNLTGLLIELMATGSKNITNVQNVGGFDLVGMMGLTYGTVTSGTGGGLLASDTDTVLAAAANINGVKDNVRNALGRIGNLSQTVNRRSEFLSTSIANSSALISSIFDADMAEEQLNATKGTIASQVGTTMLGQLNSSPQQLMSLFR